MENCKKCGAHIPPITINRGETLCVDCRIERDRNARR